MRKLFLLAGLLVATSTQATLIIGNSYLDTNGQNWEFVGSYDIGSGPVWHVNPRPINYSALEAAEAIFGQPGANATYAISTSSAMVDHLAWYDGYGTGTHLPTYNTYGSGIALAEDFFADAGALGYTTFGDFSAWIGGDRAAIGGGAFNHVFVSAAQVPEPASLVLMGLGFLGMSLSRKLST